MGDYGGGYGGGAFGGGGFVARCAKCLWVCPQCLPRLTRPRSPGEANKDAGDRGVRPRLSPRGRESSIPLSL